MYSFVPLNFASLFLSMDTTPVQGRRESPDSHPFSSFGVRSLCEFPEDGLQLENKTKSWWQFGLSQTGSAICPSFLVVKFLSLLGLFQGLYSSYPLSEGNFLGRVSGYLMRILLSFLDGDHHPQINFLFTVQYLKAGNFHTKWEAWDDGGNAFRNLVAGELTVAYFNLLKT